MAWMDTLSATHGVFIPGEGAAKAWEDVFRAEIPNLMQGEVEKALHEAKKREEQTNGFKMCAYDIVDWVTKSRRGWKERSEIKDGWEYFPDRDRICGQIWKKKVI